MKIDNKGPVQHRQKCFLLDSCDEKAVCYLRRPTLQGSELGACSVSRGQEVMLDQVTSEGKVAKSWHSDEVPSALSLALITCKFSSPPRYIPPLASLFLQDSGTTFLVPATTIPLIKIPPTGNTFNCHSCIVRHLPISGTKSDLRREYNYQALTLRVELTQAKHFCPLFSCIIAHVFRNFYR